MGFNLKGFKRGYLFKEAATPLNLNDFMHPTIEKIAPNPNASKVKSIPSMALPSKVDQSTIDNLISVFMQQNPKPPEDVWLTRSRYMGSNLFNRASNWLQNKALSGLYKVQEGIGNDSEWNPVASTDTQDVINAGNRTDPMQIDIATAFRENLLNRVFSFKITNPSATPEQINLFIQSEYKRLLPLAQGSEEDRNRLRSLAISDDNRNTRMTIEKNLTPEQRKTIPDSGSAVATSETPTSSGRPVTADNPEGAAVGGAAAAGSPTATGPANAPAEVKPVADSDLTHIKLIQDELSEQKAGFDKVMNILYNANPQSDAMYDPNILRPQDMAKAQAYAANMRALQSGTLAKSGISVWTNKAREATVAGGSSIPGQQLAQDTLADSLGAITAASSTPGNPTDALQEFQLRMRETGYGSPKGIGRGNYDAGLAYHNRIRRAAAGRAVTEPLKLDPNAMANAWRRDPRSLVAGAQMPADYDPTLRRYPVADVNALAPQRATWGMGSNGIVFKPVITKAVRDAQAALPGRSEGDWALAGTAAKDIATGKPSPKAPATPPAQSGTANAVGAPKTTPAPVAAAPTGASGTATPAATAPIQPATGASKPATAGTPPTATPKEDPAKKTALWGGSGNWGNIG